MRNNSRAAIRITATIPIPAPIPAFAPVLRPLAGTDTSGVLEMVVDGRFEEVVAFAPMLEDDTNDIVAELLTDELVEAASMKN